MPKHQLITQQIALKNKLTWQEEFRDYFDKNLKPKKPTMKNLDREILVDFFSKVLSEAYEAGRQEGENQGVA